MTFASFDMNEQIERSYFYIINFRIYIIKLVEGKMDLVFIYADIPFWRAEVGRIALYIGDIEFKDLRVSGEEFKNIKESGSYDGKFSIPLKDE